MSQPKVLSDAFGKPLKSAGFKKKRGDSWFLENKSTILVVNLQKSSYGPQYYVNLAVWLKALGEAESPPEHKCHVRLRWGALMAEADRLPERLLDLGDTLISDEVRVAEIGRLLHDCVLPFFSRVSSLTGLRTLFQSNALPRNCSVNRKAQELLATNGNVAI